MKQLLCLLCLCLSSCVGTLYHVDETYVDYQASLAERYGIKVSFPDEMVTYSRESDPEHIISFARSNNFDCLSPLFHAGPMVRLDEHCVVILPDAAHMSSYLTDNFPMYIPAGVSGYVSPFAAMTVYNRGGVWSKAFFSTDVLPVVRDKSLIAQWPDSRPRPEVTPSELKDWQQVNKEYMGESLAIRNDVPATRATNADTLYQVRIFAPRALKCHDSKWNDIFNEVNTCLYGVDFYKSDRHCFFGMLVLFEHRSGVTIDDYLDVISRYVSFDPQFESAD